MDKPLTCSCLAWPKIPNRNQKVDTSFKSQIQKRQIMKPSKKKSSESSVFKYINKRKTTVSTKGVFMQWKSFHLAKKIKNEVNIFRHKKKTPFNWWQTKKDFKKWRLRRTFCLNCWWRPISIQVVSNWLHYCLHNSNNYWSKSWDMGVWQFPYTYSNRYDLNDFYLLFHLAQTHPSFGIKTWRISNRNTWRRYFCYKAQICCAFCCNGWNSFFRICLLSFGHVLRTHSNKGVDSNGSHWCRWRYWSLHLFIHVWLFEILH